MIGFAGLSHLGIVSSLAASAKGCTVVAYDRDHELVDRLHHGIFPILEPNLPGLFASHGKGIRFSAEASSLKECDLIVFSLDIPTDNNNCSDLAPLSELVREVVACVGPRTAFVILSQVPPGFTRSISRNIQGSPFFYQVETLVFGVAVERALQPERFIVGCSDPTEDLPLPFKTYLELFDCPILKMRYESAELAKIAINMFLISSVSMTNTLAEICEAVGADWSEIIPTLRLDKRIGPHAYITPGLGISGGNLERDLTTVRSLAREFGTDCVVGDACVSNSVHRKNWALRLLHSEVLSKRDGACIAVLGLTYKPNTASVKNSSAIELIDHLGSFTVKTYDPQAGPIKFRSEKVVRMDSAVQACAGADAVVVATAWPEFSTLDLQQVRRSMAGNAFIDPYGTVTPSTATDAGLRYFRLGSPR